MRLKHLPFHVKNSIDRKREGFSLVEVVLAIGVVSLCIITLCALIPVGLQANKGSRDQILALEFCRDLQSDLRSTPRTSNSSPLYQIQIPATGTSSPITTILYDSNAISATGPVNNTAPSFSTSPNATSRFRFTITVQPPQSIYPAPATPPTDPAMSYAVLASIAVTWPPSIPATTSAPPVGTINVSASVSRVGS